MTLEPRDDRPLRAALFDFDGTLAPNLDLPDMRRQVIALTQTTPVPEHVYENRYIVEIIDAATTWLHQNEADQAPAYNNRAHQLITDIELSAAHNTQPFSDARNWLARHRNQGLKLGVVTRNCRQAVLTVFPDMLAYVDTLYARDDTQYLKPDPRHLTACLADLDTQPEQAVMIGDGALDMHAGRALNMLCVGVLSGSADTNKLLEAGAHQVIEHCGLLDLTAG